MARWSRARVDRICVRAKRMRKEASNKWKLSHDANSPDAKWFLHHKRKVGRTSAAPHQPRRCCDLRQGQAVAAAGAGAAWRKARAGRPGAVSARARRQLGGSLARRSELPPPPPSTPPKCARVRSGALGFARGVGGDYAHSLRRPQLAAADASNITQKSIRSGNRPPPNHP
ncbi:Protein of unknown function [Gryllus bimaculatus]|nr:Protein of unknown function [Gryllus bimaculatus]